MRLLSLPAHLLLAANRCLLISAPLSIRQAVSTTLTHSLTHSLNLFTHSFSISFGRLCVLLDCRRQRHTASIATRHTSLHAFAKDLREDDAAASCQHTTAYDRGESTCRLPNRRHSYTSFDEHTIAVCTSSRSFRSLARSLTDCIVSLYLTSRSLQSSESTIAHIATHLHRQATFH